MHCTRLHKGPAHMYELRAKKPLSLRKVNCKTLDVVVSFDGTWGKEGLTSLEEVFIAIKVHSRCTLLPKAWQKCPLKQSQCEPHNE